MRRVWNRIQAGGAAVLLAFRVVPIALHDMSAQMTVSALLDRSADEAAKNVEKYCEKPSQLSSEAKFKDSIGNSTGASDADPERDASVFIAPLVDWYTGQAAAPSFLPQRRESMRRRGTGPQRWTPPALPSPESGEAEIRRGACPKRPPASIGRGPAPRISGSYDRRDDCG
jgi:hypothetical protein